MNKEIAKQELKNTVEYAVKNALVMRTVFMPVGDVMILMNAPMR